MAHIRADIFGDKDHFVDAPRKTFHKDEIVGLLQEKGIALSDTGKEVVRTKDNASDKWLRIDKPIDLAATLSELPECRAVATTGEKAAGIVAMLTSTDVPKVGEFRDCVLPLADGRMAQFRHWRMPSTSRAYPMRLEDKAAFYRKMLEATGLL